jgi:hypothetical protein
MLFKLDGSCNVMSKKSIIIVRCIPIARQRVAKHIPATHAHATIGRLLLGNGAVNTAFNNRRRCFPWGPPRGYITKISRS